MKRKITTLPSQTCQLMLMSSNDHSQDKMAHFIIAVSEYSFSDTII